MELYTLETYKKDNFRFYSRKPEDIVNLIEDYHKKAVKDGMMDNPRLGKWARRIPTIDEISVTKMGRVIFQAGMMSMNEKYKNEPLFEKLIVTPDFYVEINLESVLNFDLFRSKLFNCKRLNLYKIQLDFGIVPGLTFVPEDIMQAICAYDLKPISEKAKDLLEEIARVKSGHPNLA